MGTKRSKKISLSVEKYYVRLFSWAFLSAMALLVTFHISESIGNLWWGMLVDLIGFGVWIILMQLEVNQWVKKAKMYLG